MQDSYTCHYFYKDKLVIGMDLQTSSAQLREDSSYYELHRNTPHHLSEPRGFLVDIATNRVLRYIHAEEHASILDDILYYTYDRNLYAVDINTGQKLMDIELPKCYQAGPTSSVYKNAKGEKFVIVSSTNCTYCYPGL